VNSEFPLGSLDHLLEAAMFFQEAQTEFNSTLGRGNSPEKDAAFHAEQAAERHLEESVLAYAAVLDDKRSGQAVQINADMVEAIRDAQTILRNAVLRAEVPITRAATSTPSPAPGEGPVAL
jgi:hypothetical protein